MTTGTIDHKQACRDIFEKSRQYPVAVFSMTGDIVTIIAKGKKFEKMVKDFPRKLVGVYDSRCTVKMIEDDIL